MLSLFWTSFELILLKHLVLEDEGVNVGGEPEPLLLLHTGDEGEEVGVVRVEKVVDLAGLGDESGEGPLNISFLTGS